ncbi:anti-anti-sigma factor GigB [Acinetobacter bohemicus]|uniref:Anti-anti-sigma factor GigB n=1 Tax=Acinetobacter lwoffii TaxID=28090 RepID=A0A9D2ZZ70_ACILW|nr:MULTISPECIES: anti-anti-sigma factor GigB [Acinetobacter]MDM1782302.1 anti-anti-sigma factor GigB [Acinetobacter indicus]HJF27993.1 anti-anti-sigma factor GigB [Acinetobacter lwoffii]MCO8042610.1 anti-anti-sigma factor GigB [Acinetobacter sp. S4400-12]MCO8045884.1 anti-anti-sigma factor GigB [Acinetobacter sp. S4397-1]MCU7224937.1 anti-anti-sigma factor GigB [Acinetobacter bohemicus]
MSTGHVEYASLNGTHIFKLIGEVRAQSCISLDKLLNKLEQQDNVVGAIVDLTETSFIDSTVLGVLAKLGLKLKQIHEIQPVMLSTNSDITTLANSMGLGQVFVILNYCGDSNVCTRALMEEHITHQAMLSTVLDAHKTLMKLNQSNQNMFEPLVKQLQKEQDSLDKTSEQKV